MSEEKQTAAAAETEPEPELEEDTREEEQPLDIADLALVVGGMPPRP